MKARTGLLTLALFLLAGCAPGPDDYWYHPDKTLKQAKADYCECEARAEKEAREMAADEALARSRTRSRSADDDWEYYNEQVAARSNPVMVYEKNVLEGCMRGRGYVKVPEHRLPSELRTKDYAQRGVAGR